MNNNKTYKLLTYKYLIVTLAIALAGSACSSSTSSDDDNNEETSTTDVLSFEAQEQRGTSTLTRTDDGISYTISTAGLEPGTANTLWVVIFNQPEHCEDGCDDPDLFNPDVMADVVFGGDGHVIGSSGEATFTGVRDTGGNSGSILGEWLELPENGLIDPWGAEIHFVIHSHGPVIEGLEEEMISTFNAGCGEFFFPEGEAPPVPESLGTHGPNTCTDEQFAVHPPSDEY